MMFKRHGAIYAPAGMPGAGGSGAIRVSSLPSVYIADFSAAGSNPFSDPAFINGADSLSTPVQTDGNLAFGTQSGLEYTLGPDGTSGKYNDSHCWLRPDRFFSRNHRVEIEVELDPGGHGGDLEIECLLGASVGALRSPTPFYGPTHTNVVEVNFALGTFGTFVGVYRFLDTEGANYSSEGGAWGIQTGDWFCAQLVLDDINQTGTVTVSMKRSEFGTETVFGSVTLATLYCVGQPGFGFYNQDNTTDADRKKFCITKFKAIALP